MALRTHRAPELARALLGTSIWAYRISYPGLLLLLVTGVWMGFAGHHWGRAWIWVSIGLLIALFAAMAGISVAYHRAREAPPDDDRLLEERLARTRPLTASWVGSLGLLALVFLMVFKPF